jgi:hypothetical protein
MRRLHLITLFLFLLVLQACGQRRPITLHARFDDKTATAADRRETVEIITKRFANFLHGKHSIAYDSVSGTVTFTLPQLKDTAVYVSLITSVGSLAFMETYMFPEVGMEFFGMVEAMSEDEEISNILSAADTSYKNLFAVMYPNVYPNGDFIRDPVFGRSLSTDTAMISGILNDTAALAYMGQNIIFRWYYDPVNNIWELIGIKPVGEYKAVTNVMMQHVSTEKAFHGGYYINVMLHPQYRRIWSKLTRENIGRSLAVVMDGKVLAYPMVNSEIKGGNSSIGGHFGQTHARMIESILKFGETKTSLVIVQ